jgi:hypothetical protein
LNAKPSSWLEINRQLDRAAHDAEEKPQIVCLVPKGFLTPHAPFYTAKTTEEAETILNMSPSAEADLLDPAKGEPLRSRAKGVPPELRGI